MSSRSASILAHRQFLWMLLALAIIGVVFVLCVWTTAESWQATRRQALQHENNVLLAVEGEIAQAIRTFDHGLQVVAAGMATADLAAMPPPLQHALLFNALGASGASGGAIVTNRDGDIAYSWLGGEPKGFNAAGGALFEPHRRGTATGPVLGLPLESPLDGKWVIGLSRGLRNQDGSFAGIVMGRIPLKFFQDMLDRLDNGKNSVILLATTEARLLARNPFRAVERGSDLSATIIGSAMRTAPSGIVEGKATPDGINRIVTYRTIAGMPFIIAVGLSTDEVFKDWLQRSVVIWVVMALLLVLGMISAAMLGRQSRERLRTKAHALKTAAANQARLEKLSHHLAENHDQAVQANAAKSRFLTGVTHELRTPLNGILGYAQLLSIEGGLTFTQRYRVEAMQAAGEHLLGMINAVLDLSQIDSDCIELQPAEIDLRRTMRGCLDLLGPEAQLKGLSLSMSIDTSAPERLLTDPTRLRQVLVNLLGNAVKFTPAGTVQLRLLPGRAASTVRFEVVDTGPGIPADQRHKLFKEFERLDIDKRTTEGSGLGLAITSRLVQRMGGEVGYLDSPAGGSVFWCDIPPIHAPAPEALAANLHDNPADDRPATLRVLIVDDVAMNSEIAMAFLRLDGHDAHSVDSGPAAIEAVIAQEFDVVLMDVRMPGMDGLEATRRIRALPTNRARVPIVALTAQAFADQIDKCRAAGMDGHVAKPFQRDTLLKSVIDAVTPRPAPA